MKNKLRVQILTKIKKCQKMCKYLNIFLCCIGILNACARVKTGEAIKPKVYKKNYPEWFWKMPVDENFYYVVGIAEIEDTSDLEKAIERAKQDLFLEASFVSGTAVTVFKEVSETRKGDSCVSYIRIKPLKPIDNTVKADIIEIAIVEDKLVLILGRVKIKGKPGLGKINIDEVLKEQKNLSEWISPLPKVIDKCVFIGGTWKFRETFGCRNWKLAEDNVRKKLAMELGARIKSLIRKNSYLLLAENIISEYQVLRRYLDKDNGLCTVLMGIRYKPLPPESKPPRLLKKKVKKTLKKLEEVSKKEKKKQK